MTRPLVAALVGWSYNDGCKSGIAQLRIRNRYDFLSLGHLNISATLEVDGLEVGFLPPVKLHSLASLRPGDCAEVELHLTLVRLAGSQPRNTLLLLEAFLSVRATLSAPTGWAPVGHLVAEEQFAVDPPRERSLAHASPPVAFNPLLAVGGGAEIGGKHGGKPRKGALRAASVGSALVRRTATRSPGRKGVETPVVEVPAVVGAAGLGIEEVGGGGAVLGVSCPLSCSETEAGFFVDGCAAGGGSFSIFVCKRKGTLESLRVGGTDIITSGPDLS